MDVFMGVPLVVPLRGVMGPVRDRGGSQKGRVVGRGRRAAYRTCGVRALSQTSPWQAMCVMGMA